MKRRTSLPGEKTFPKEKGGDENDDGYTAGNQRTSLGTQLYRSANRRRDKILPSGRNRRMQSGKRTQHPVVSR